MIGKTKSFYYLAKLQLKLTRKNEPVESFLSRIKKLKISLTLNFLL